MTSPIILYGAPVLRKHSLEVTDEDNIPDITGSLFDTLKKAEGIGLAAPQINLLKRAFVIDTSPLIKGDLTIERFERVFINPLILYRSAENEIYKEGCLSFPGIFEDVKRPDRIVVRYKNEYLTEIEEELDGIKARIFQHEFDHLEGILFTDRISRIRRYQLQGRLNKIRKLS